MRHAVLWFSMLSAWTPGVALAQTSLQIPLQFDFINPGAKSLAMGGAFAGLADDATASFANPAGLRSLNASELSIELKGASTDSLFLESGRLSGTILNEGTDIIQGPLFKSSPNSNTGVGFLAGVYAPSAYNHRLVFAGYRHELVRVDQSFLSNGVFQQASGELTSRRDSPQQGDRSVSITGYGVSGAFAVRQNLAVGAALTFYHFSIDSVFTRYDIVGFLGPPNLNVVEGQSSQKGSDVSAAPTLGLIFDHKQTRFGLVYRHGATFEFTTHDGTAPVRESRFRVPDTFAFGSSISLQHGRNDPGLPPPSFLLLAVEVTYITYSRLVSEFVSDQAVATGTQADFSIDDGTEVHVGAQYAMPRLRGTPRFRGGFWFDPDHSVHFSPVVTSPSALDQLFNERLATALSTGSSQYHYTGGLGLTLARWMELNVGVDLSSRHHTVSASLVVSRNK